MRYAFGSDSRAQKLYGYIYNAWANGEKKLFNNSMQGLTFPAMKEEARHDPTIALRVKHLIYRTAEELYDYSQDADALVNLVEEPNHRPEVERYRALMRATEDPELEGDEQFLETAR